MFTNLGSDPAHTLNGGLTYLRTDNLQLDIMGGLELTGVRTIISSAPGWRSDFEVPHERDISREAV